MKNFILGALLLSTSAFANNTLVIGDSHTVGPFGRELDRLIRDSGEQVATYSSCGSIVKWWITGQATPCGYFFKTLEGKVSEGTKGPTPLIKNILVKNNPDKIIIAMGANYANMPSDDFMKKDLNIILDLAKENKIKCLWVTPPDARKNPESRPRLKKIIKEVAGDYCEIFESDLVTKYPATGGDGVHYWSTLGTPIAKAWAKKVFDVFQDL